MFGKKDNTQPKTDYATNIINDLLLDGEVIESIYPLIVDFLCVTNKRLLFVDTDISVSKPKTKFYSISFNKVEAVSFEKNDKIMAFTDTLEITTKAKTHELKFIKGTDMNAIFKHVVSKTL